MSRIEDAAMWADVGLAVSGILDRYITKPSALTADEVKALVRAAYAAGYVDALDEPAPSTILDACRYAETLRLTLPLSS